MIYNSKQEVFRPEFISIDFPQGIIQVLKK